MGMELSFGSQLWSGGLTIGSSGNQFLMILDQSGCVGESAFVQSERAIEIRRISRYSHTVSSGWLSHSGIPGYPGILSPAGSIGMNIPK
jgi:hypothetical protein